jgi:hypothetical protein
MTEIRVTRRGGFAGQDVSGRLDTRGTPGGAELEAIVKRHRKQRRLPLPPSSDAPTYTIQAGGERIEVSEAELTGELATLVHRVLGQRGL